MIEYLLSIVKPLVSKPDKVHVTQALDAKGVLLTLSVAREDMGRVIGKEGRHMRSIRDIVGLYGILNEAKISVKLSEPDGSFRRPLADNQYDHASQSDRY